MIGRGLTKLLRWGDPLIGMVRLRADQILHYGGTLLEVRPTRPL
jgi:hypothetical protein